MRAWIRRVLTRRDHGRHRASGRRHERGVAAVEMAIIAPVLVTLMAGIVDFGYRYQQHIAYTNAAMQSARAMSISNNVTTATTAARAIVSPTATVVVSANGCAAGVTTVKVDVSATRSTVTHLFGKTFTVKGSGQVRCE